MVTRSIETVGERHFAANHILGKKATLIEERQEQELYKAKEVVVDQATLERRTRINRLSIRLLESQVFSLIARFLDFRQVLELQLLN